MITDYDVALEVRVCVAVIKYYDGICTRRRVKVSRVKRGSDRRRK